MSKSPPTVEAALTELRRLVRLPPPAEAERTVMHGPVPDDLATVEARTLHLQPGEARALTELRWLLSEDQRFEYMDEREVKESTWRFVCLANLKPDESHVEDFIATYSREPMRLTCFFPVAHLTVTEELSFQGARLIPAAEAEPPGMVLGPDPRPTMASVIAVECTGTDHKKMNSRAVEVAQHALRLLRAGLREERFVPDRQLRFRLGESFWFSDGISGWQAEPAVGWDYEPGGEVLRRATSQPISALPLVGGNDLERHANLAVQWFEQAQLAIDPLMELLFVFFALEAILGKKSEKNKARGLALRRAVLSHKTTEHFAHPGRVYGLYEQVRSAAVHGSEPPKVPKDELDAFAWDARRALNEFLAYARAEGLVKRARVLRALDSDPAVPELVERFLPDET